MRYCRIFPNIYKPGALALLQKINADLRQIGLEINAKGILAYDETDTELLKKLRVIFDKYSNDLSNS